jgi:hypothetical protein
MIYNHPDTDPTINPVHLTSGTSKGLDLVPNKVISEYYNGENIHEHLYNICNFFQLDHMCSKSMLVKCVTCNRIFCNCCGKRIKL